MGRVGSEARWGRGVALAALLLAVLAVAAFRSTSAPSIARRVELPPPVAAGIAAPIPRKHPPSRGGSRATSEWVEPVRVGSEVPAAFDGSHAGASDAAETLRLVRRLTAQMSDAEILEALTRWTSLERESVEGVRDLPTYVERLAELLLGTGIANVEGGSAPLLFARSVDPEGRTILEDTAFHDRVRAIYAVFPTTFEAAAVWARWTRAGDSEVLLFDRHEIDPDRESNYVWFEPDAGWSEGSYRVEIYAAAEALVPLGVGAFEIVPIGKRR